VKNETRCFVLPQFMLCCARAVLKRRQFHIWGLEETAREGWLLYFGSETDISYISSLIVLHYNTRRVFYVWTSAERRENVLRKWQGRFWKLYTFQYTQHSHSYHKRNKNCLLFWGKIASSEDTVITFTLLATGM